MFYSRIMLSKVNYFVFLIELQDNAQGDSGYNTSLYENGASFHLSYNVILPIDLNWLF